MGNVKKIFKDGGSGMMFVSSAGKKIELIVNNESAIDLYIDGVYKNTLINSDLQRNGLADNEDLVESNGVLKFKNNEYNISEFSGYGRIILRKNIVGDMNVLSQSVINKEYCVYDIRYDFDLNGETINLPIGCTLNFIGGSFSNGTIVINQNCELKSIRVGVFNNIVLCGQDDTCYFKGIASDNLFTGDDLVILNNLRYFEGCTLSRDYIVAPGVSEFVLAVYDRDYIIDGCDNTVELNGLGGSFINFNSRSSYNVGNTLTMKNITIEATGNVSSINNITGSDGNYVNYAVIAAYYAPNVIFDRANIYSSGICMINYGASQFVRRLNSITITHSKLLSNWFVIEDGAEFINIDHSTLGPYSDFSTFEGPVDMATGFQHDVISNGYNGYTVNITISNSKFLGCIELETGDVLVNNCTLDKSFNVGRRDDVATTYNNLNVSIYGSKFMEQYPGIKAPGEWNMCKSVTIESCEFFIDPVNYYGFISIGSCGVFNLTNCVFSMEHAIDINTSMFFMALSRADYVNSILLSGNTLNALEKSKFVLRSKFVVFNGSNDECANETISKIKSCGNYILEEGGVNQFGIETHSSGNVNILESQLYNHYIFENSNKLGVKPLFATFNQKIGFMHLSDPAVENDPKVLMYHAGDNVWVEVNA